LVKRGKGRFSDSCKFNFETLNKRKHRTSHGEHLNQDDDRHPPYPEATDFLASMKEKIG